jgi:hypothetical protein
LKEDFKQGETSMDVLKFLNDKYGLVERDSDAGLYINEEIGYACFRLTDVKDYDITKLFPGFVYQDEKSGLWTKKCFDPDDQILFDYMKENGWNYEGEEPDENDLIVIWRKDVERGIGMKEETSTKSGQKVFLSLIERFEKKFKDGFSGMGRNQFREEWRKSEIEPIRKGKMVERTTLYAVVVKAGTKQQMAVYESEAMANKVIELARSIDKKGKYKFEVEPLELVHVLDEKAFLNSLKTKFEEIIQSK